MNTLSITISGLCLVIVQAKRYATDTDSVQVLIPECEGHRPRLTFRRPDRVYQDAVPLDRFFGPGGEDLLSLHLSKTRGRFIVPGNPYPRFNMRWGYQPVPQPSTSSSRPPARLQKNDQPVPDDVLDWLIDADDIGLNIANFDKVTTWIELPPGRIRSKNLILEDGEPMSWKYHQAEADASALSVLPEIRRHALADDILIETRGAEPMSFVWRDSSGGDRKRIDFAASIHQPLELCISNDDVIDDSFGIRTANPNKDLEHLAVAVGQAPETLDIPVEADERETNGWTCPQAVYFDHDGTYRANYGDV